MPDQVMISSDGEIGDVPENKVAEAEKVGFKRAIELRNPNNNQTAMVPFDQVDAYLRAGFTIIH
jgi:predicted ATP-dependent serine protease